MPPFPPPRIFSLSQLLKSYVPLTLDNIAQFLNRNGIADQAIWKGQTMISTSCVRGLSFENKQINDGKESLLHVTALVESEYIMKSNVYLVTCVLGKEKIQNSKCCCIAANRLYGACKHESALFHALFIIQKQLFEISP